MEKKILIGVAVVLVLCVCVVGGVFLLRDGNAGTTLSERISADKDDDRDADGKGDASDSEDAEAEEQSEEAEEAAAAGVYVSTGRSSATGTSADQSYSIRMSDLCTFTDSAGLKFDRRYVLYGGADCTPARAARQNGCSCVGAYEILYVRGGQPVGEYMCYVMSSVADAQKMVSLYADAGSSDYRVGRWGDVAYVYSSGSYVQTTIDTYYSYGVLKDKTPESYLGMQFLFRGMSEYRQSGNGNGSVVTVPSTDPTNPFQPGNGGGTIPGAGGTPSLPNVEPEKPAEDGKLDPNKKGI